MIIATLLYIKYLRGLVVIGTNGVPSDKAQEYKNLDFDRILDKLLHICLKWTEYSRRTMRL